VFEHRGEPLLPRQLFYARLLRGFIISLCLVGGSLLLGVCGYHWLGHLGWIDAILNASMILGGMGPVDPITNVGGKLFASAYALFSGFMLLTSAGVLVAPVVHRFLHRFHVEGDAGSE
jgi:hypothetical protein